MINRAGWVLLGVLLARAAPGHAEPGLGLIDPGEVTTLPIQPGTHVAPGIALSHDANDRMTVPVTVDGQGPFAFIIDTGADHTVVSTELAAALKLAPGPTAMVRSTSDARPEPTVRISEIRLGASTAHAIMAPMLSRAAIGADGILGIDAVRDQAMVMNFKTRQMSVRPSHPSADDPNSVVVYATSRFGQLVLLDASVRGVRVYVILDSGSQDTVANSTFRRLMVDGQRALAGSAPTKVISVTGGSTDGQFATLQELTLGPITLHVLPIVFADLYTFRLFHLDHRPAMLLGMDVLRAFSLVEVDYPKRQARFRLNTG